MPIPANIYALSTTPASNSPGGGESAILADDYLREWASYIALLRDVVLAGTSSLTTLNLAYTGTLTGGAGIVNIGSGQFYKDASGNVGIGTATPSNKLHVAGIARISDSTNSTAVVIDSATTAGLTSISTQYGGSQLALGTTGTERMRIDSTGNVGIGTNTPTSKLDVAGNISVNAGALVAYAASSQSTTISGAIAPYYGLGIAATHTGFGGAGTSLGGYYGLMLHTSGLERMRIDSAGNVGIGTVPSYKLDVLSNSSTFHFGVKNSHASTPYGIINTYTGAAPNNSGNEFLYCGDISSARATIRSNGGLANFSANNVNLSDARTKTDIQPASGYYARWQALQFRTFLYRDQTDTERNLGVIAQELETVCPELVDVSGFGETPADGVPMKAIYQTDFQYATAMALQEAIAVIEDLRARVATLEAAK